MAPRLRPRLLLVEDDDARAQVLQGWAPGRIHFVRARSAAPAIAAMVTLLREHRFLVDRTPMGELRQDPSPLHRWFYEGLEAWEDGLD